jgi:predicted glycosyltransferase
MRVWVDLWARPRGFDLPLGHGSNDASVATRLLRIPCSTMFDYRWATLQHTLNCRLAQAVVVPDAIPPDRLARYGTSFAARIPIATWARLSIGHGD